MPTKKITATVALLTFNAAEFFDEVLAGITRQKADFSFEILLIDSGSTDQTLEIAAKYPNIRLHQIPNRKFGHGKTRNLAAQLAEGEFIVYLTQDAVPAHDRWLAEMIRPFAISDKVMCVYGKQIPRPGCCPTTKRDIINVFAGFGPDYALAIQEQNRLLTSRQHLDSLMFFSDVNSAVRQSLLLDQIPYQELNYAEDQALGHDVIAGGYRKVYTPFGAVVHSHSYPPVKYFRRMYDEMVGLKLATGATLDTSIRFHIAWTVRATLQDWRFILRDRDYGRRAKLKWFLQAPVYNAERRLAIRLARRDKLPGWAHNFFSLEVKARQKAK